MGHEEEVKMNIVIKFKDRSTVVWKENSWDDYCYEGSVFVVKKDGAWIGIYNMCNIISIEVIEEDLRRLEIKI